MAVIGPNANRAHLGGYSDPNPPLAVSVLDGIRNKVGSSIRVNYAEGVKITKEGGNWFGDTATLNDQQGDRKLINEAVETAKNSDAVVLVIGGNEDTNKEGWAETHLGDRDSLDLVGRQNDLVEAILQTGKPTAVFLINSGPLSRRNAWGRPYTATSCSSTRGRRAARGSSGQLRCRGLPG